jgi:type I restriction enzyme S subunit
MKPLGVIANVRVSNVDKKISPVEKRVKLCNYMDVYSNTYVSRELDFMEGSASPSEIERFTLMRGDVVITKDSETPDDIGIPAIIGDDIEDLVCGYHLALIRPEPGEVDSVFLGKQLATPRAARFFGQRATGSTRYGLPISAIVSITIPTPPRTEQEKIAQVLMAVDHAIEHTEGLIAKHHRVRTGLMQNVLTRGIDVDGRLRSPQTHKFKASPLGRIPVEWDVSMLEAIAVVLTSGSRGWAQYYAVDGAIFLRIGNLTRDHINLRLEDIVRVSPPKASEGERTLVAPGDLLISITADLGIVGVVPDGFEKAYVNQHIALVRLVPARAHSRFIGWFLSGRGGQAQFERLNESGAKAGLNLPTVGRLLVPTMDMAEQQRIADVLDAATQRANDEYGRLHKLRLLKGGVMQDLLTGRTPVTPLLEDAPVPALRA